MKVTTKILSLTPFEVETTFHNETPNVQFLALERVHNWAGDNYSFSDDKIRIKAENYVKPRTYKRQDLMRVPPGASMRLTFNLDELYDIPEENRQNLTVEYVGTHPLYGV